MRIHLSKIFSSVWQTVFRQTLPVCSMSTRHHRCSHSPFLHHHLPPRHHLHPSSLFPRLSHTYTTDSSPLPKSNRCWRCERELDKDDGSRVNFFCPCDKHVVLPPSNTHNYFEIMDCPPTYRLDVEVLKERFKQLQRQLHPDRFSTASPEEQEFSAGQSTLVNRAYSTLLRPYSRGLYLLELNGLTIDEKDTLTDAPEFLEEMWEVRESIDDASDSEDTAALLQLQITNSANLENISEEVAASFDSGDYAAAKEGLARMKYFVNIEETLKDRLDLPPS